MKMNIKIFTVLMLALTTMPGFANQATNADEKFLSSCESAAKNVAKFKANKDSLYSRRNLTYHPTSLEMEQKMADDSNVFSNMASKYNNEVNKCVEEYRQKKYAKGETIRYEESTCNCNPDNAKPAPTTISGEQIYGILKCGCSGAWSYFQDSCKDQPIDSIQDAYEKELINKYCNLDAHKKAEQEQLNQTSEQINNTIKNLKIGDSISYNTADADKAETKKAIKDFNSACNKLTGKNHIEDTIVQTSTYQGSKRVLTCLILDCDDAKYKVSKDKKSCIQYVSAEQKAFKNQIIIIKDAFHKRVEELIKECEDQKGTISENGECVEPEQKGEKQ